MKKNHAKIKHHLEKAKHHHAKAMEHLQGMGMEFKEVPKGRGVKKPNKSEMAKQVPKTIRAKRNDNPY